MVKVHSYIWILSFNNILLSSYYVSGFYLGTQDTEIKKKKKQDSYPHVTRNQVLMKISAH